MPEFRFRRLDTGELLTLEFATLGEYWAAVDDDLCLDLPDGGRAQAYAPRADEVDELQLRARWPFHCEALAVHPDQRAAAMARARRAGVPTDYDPHGRPILTGPGHRRKLLAVEGFFDRRGYD